MDTKSMIIGTNKFFFYAMNYPLVKITFPSIAGGNKTEYLPSFFKDFPPHIIEHFVGKWKSACDQGSYGAIMYFYGQLDGSYRKIMLEHIMNNYTDEQKIYFND